MEIPKTVSLTQLGIEISNYHHEMFRDRSRYYLCKEEIYLYVGKWYRFQSNQTIFILPKFRKILLCCFGDLYLKNEAVRSH